MKKGKVLNPADKKWSVIHKMLMFICCVLFTGNVIMAQNTGRTVKGQVRDNSDQLPMVGVSVSVLGGVKLSPELPLTWTDASRWTFLKVLNLK